MLAVQGPSNVGHRETAPQQPSADLLVGEEVGVGKVAVGRVGVGHRRADHLGRLGPLKVLRVPLDGVVDRLEGVPSAGGAEMDRGAGADEVVERGVTTYVRRSAGCESESDSQSPPK
jgi:hypothetical protein